MIEPGDSWEPAEFFRVPHLMLTDEERENVTAAYYAGVAAAKTATQVNEEEHDGR